MDLTEKDLLMLSLLAELKLPVERGEFSSVKEWIGLAEKTCNGNEIQKNLVHEAMNHDAIQELQLVALQNWGDFQAFVLCNKDTNARVTVFGYQSETELEGLQKLYNNDGALHEETVHFLRTHQGEGQHTATGHSVGGAVAIYAAAQVRCEGMVFDAPGVGQLMTSMPRESIKATNYLAYNSLLSAMGIHPEKVLFARPHRQPEMGVYPDPWKDKYAFDDQGRIQVGEKGELYELFAQLNRLIIADSVVFEEVVSVFADVVNHKEVIVHSDPAGVLAILEHLENGHITKALAEVELRMARNVDLNIMEAGKEIRELVNIGLSLDEQASFHTLEDKTKQIVEQAMIQASQTVKDYCQVVQVVLSACLICFPDKELDDEFEQSLDRFIDAAELKMREASRQIGKELNAVMEARIQRLMAPYDLTIDL